MPTPRFTAPKPAIDLDTLQVIIECRYDVLAKYARSLKRAYARELGKLGRFAPQDARALLTLKPWLYRDEKVLRETERMKLAVTLPKVHALQTMYSMRSELAAVWGRSMPTRHQLVEQLQDWCQRAEASGIDELQKFARELRSYASLSPAPLRAPAHRKPTVGSSPH